jgi:hypothetical protein
MLLVLVPLAMSQYVDPELYNKTRCYSDKVTYETLPILALHFNQSKYSIDYKVVARQDEDDDIFPGATVT